MPTHLPDLLATALGPPLRASGEQWQARCPAHDDRTPSLSIRVDSDGKVLLHCHAGCDQRIVLDALAGRGWAPEQRPDRTEWTPHGDAVAVYDYRDETGRLLFQVLRTADKQFPQRRPDPTAKTGWRWSLGDTRRVLYRLPELIEAVNAGQPVWITEGEKDVHTLVRIGHPATCNPGGAGKWRDEYSKFFADAAVTIVADADIPGQSHARQVAAALTPVARAVRTVEAAEGCKDITEHIAHGHTIADLRVTWRSDEPATVELAPDIHEFLAGPEPDYDWLVEGLLERGERLMLTGLEGLGKTVLIRQLAVTVAAGLHPFSQTRLARPLKVLVVDCENTRRQNKRAYRPLRDLAERLGAPIPAGGLRLILRPEGLNLAGEDAAWLLERVRAHTPDVLMIGPLYRLHTANLNEELPARRLVAALDAARCAVDCAVIVEAHAGHSNDGRSRFVRPTGSSLFLRWPEFGCGLRPTDEEKDERHPQVVDLLPWRGARDERAWPEQLRRGRPGGWPWLEEVDYTREWRRSIPAYTEEIIA